MKTAPTPVVAIHVILGIYCPGCQKCGHEIPAGIPEVMPGTKGVILHLADDLAIVDFDGYDHPIIVTNPKHSIRADTRC